MSAFRSQVKILDGLSRKYVSSTLPSKDLEVMKPLLFMPERATLNHQNRLFLEQQNHYGKNLFSFFRKKLKIQEKTEKLSKEENIKPKTQSRVTIFTNKFNNGKLFQFFGNLAPFKAPTKTINDEIPQTSRINKISTDISEPKPKTFPSPHRLPQILFVPPKSVKSRMMELREKHQQGLERMDKQKIDMQKYKPKLPYSELTPPKIKAPETIDLDVTDMTEKNVPQSLSQNNKSSLKPTRAKKLYPSYKNTTNYEIHSDSQISKAPSDKPKVFQECGHSARESMTKISHPFNKTTEISNDILPKNKSAKSIIRKHLRKNTATMGTPNSQQRKQITMKREYDKTLLSKTKRTKGSIQKLMIKIVNKSNLKNNSHSHHTIPFLITFPKTNNTSLHKSLKMNAKESQLGEKPQNDLSKVHTVGEMKTVDGHKRKWIKRINVSQKEIINKKKVENKLKYSSALILRQNQKNKSVLTDRTYHITPTHLPPNFIIKTKLMRKNIKISAQDILAKYNLDRIKSTIPSDSPTSKYQPQLGTKFPKVSADVKTKMPKAAKSKSNHELAFDKVEQALNPGYENNFSIQQNLTAKFTREVNEKILSSNSTSAEIQTIDTNEMKENGEVVVMKEKNELVTKNNNLQIDCKEQLNAKISKTRNRNSSSSLVPVEFYTNIRNGVKVNAIKASLTHIKKLQNEGQTFPTSTSALTNAETKMNSNMLIYGLYKGILNKKLEYLHLFSNVNNMIHSIPELANPYKNSSHLSFFNYKNKQLPDRFQGKLLFKFILLESLGGILHLPEKMENPKASKGAKAFINKGETNGSSMYFKKQKRNLLQGANNESHVSLLMSQGSKRNFSTSKPSLSNWAMQDPPLTSYNRIECRSTESKKDKKKSKKSKGPRPKSAQKKCRDVTVLTCKKLRLPGCRRTALKCGEVMERVPCVRKEPPQPSFSECLKFPLYVKKFSECDCHKKKTRICASDLKEPKHYDGCNPPEVKEKTKKEDIGEECK